MLMKIALVILVASYVATEEAKDAPKVKEEDAKKFKYVKPEANDAHLAESFHDDAGFKERWFLSKAKKDGVEDTIAKYDGKWTIDEPKDNSLPGDLALMLKSEAKHAAISSKLAKKFEFTNEPLIVQYEVKFHKTQECGGAYIKLLADGKDLDLDVFGDKSLYSVMFGPDKCGHEGKMHFILQHENPVTGKMVEHHAKAPTGDYSKIFDDKKVHLVTLIVRPGNTYDILVDKNSINSGSLLSDMTPPINPPKEIDDPEDSKPEDWDEREKIPDPDAKKPDDWDESAPQKITDDKAVKPSSWMDDEPEHVPDPDAVRPADWDTEEDGEWEAPLVPNPKCKDGECGEWKPASIANPAYKGKWVPALIANPAYKGIWAPRKIANPEYFETPNPFASLKTIAAVGFELWSMQSDITFDNIILSSDQATVDKWTAQSWDVKQAVQGGDASSAKNMFNSVVQATEDKPWLWAIYLLVIILPFVLIYTFCFPSKDKTGERKKTDEPTPDDEEDNVSNRSVDSSEDELEEPPAEEPAAVAAEEPAAKPAEAAPTETAEVEEEEATVEEKVEEVEEVVKEASADPVVAVSDATTTKIEKEVEKEENKPTDKTDEKTDEKSDAEESAKEDDDDDAEKTDDEKAGEEENTREEPEVISAATADDIADAGKEAAPEPAKVEPAQAPEPEVEEPLTNGAAETEEAAAAEQASDEDSPAPSPRATRSKKKSRKDT